MQSLKQAKELLQALGGATGASLSGTVNKVIDAEVKMFSRRTGCSAVVEKELREAMTREDEVYRKQRQELQAIMKFKKEKRQVEAELAQVQQDLKKARKSQAEAEDLLHLREACG